MKGTSFQLWFKAINFFLLWKTTRGNNLVRELLFWCLSLICFLSKWCFMSVTVCNCVHIVSHSLLLIAFSLLVLSIKCVLCFVSPVKTVQWNFVVAQCKKNSRQNGACRFYLLHFYPVDERLMGQFFKMSLRSPFTVLCDLQINLQTTVRPAVPMMRPESVEACWH